MYPPGFFFGSPNCVREKSARIRREIVAIFKSHLFYVEREGVIFTRSRRVVLGDNCLCDICWSEYLDDHEKFRGTNSPRIWYRKGVPNQKAFTKQ